MNRSGNPPLATKIARDFQLRITQFSIKIVQFHQETTSTIGGATSHASSTKTLDFLPRAGSRTRTNINGGRKGTVLGIQSRRQKVLFTLPRRTRRLPESPSGTKTPSAAAFLPLLNMLTSSVHHPILHFRKKEDKVAIIRMGGETFTKAIERRSAQLTKKPGPFARSWLVEFPIID